MKKLILIAVAFSSLCLPICAFACDTAAARNVQDMMRSMGSWNEKNGIVIFKWGSDWDVATSDQRLGLIRTFADSDACLSGSARAIKYYRGEKVVGEASPTFGIKMF